MSKKEGKEQKGNHTVLVVAVGKHPKMGPGPRNYKKTMKKAFSLLKNDAKRNARHQLFLQRQATRLKREKEDEEYKAGTASDEVRQKIDQSKQNVASGANQNIRFAQKKPETDTKRMPKKPFDTSHYDRWVQSNSLGDKKDSNTLSAENLKVLARKLAMNPADIQAKRFEGADIGALKSAMQELGKRRYEERQNRRTMSDGLPAPDKQSGERIQRVENSDYDDEDMWEELNHERHGEEEEEEDNLDVLETESERHEWEEDAAARDSTKDYGFAGLMQKPSSFTIPFGASGGVEGGRKDQPSRRSGKTKEEEGPRKRGGDTTFEEEYSGFTPPIIPTHISSPQEEEEEEELPEYPQFATGEPMDLAFRLLKNNMCKGNDSCQCPKCCGNDDEDNEEAEKFLDQCMSCGALNLPNRQCRCGN